MRRRAASARLRDVTAARRWGGPSRRRAPRPGAFRARRPAGLRSPRRWRRDARAGAARGASTRPARRGRRPSAIVPPARPGSRQPRGHCRSSGGGGKVATATLPPCPGWRSLAWDPDLRWQERQSLESEGRPGDIATEMLEPFAVGAGNPKLVLDSMNVSASRSAFAPRSFHRRKLVSLPRAIHVCRGHACAVGSASRIMRLRTTISGLVLR